MRKLLVVRNDKLGDLILILPALKLIKSSCSDVQIDCLVVKKYSEISSITKYIDNIAYFHGTKIVPSCFKGSLGFRVLNDHFWPEKESLNFLISFSFQIFSTKFRKYQIG